MSTSDFSKNSQQIDRFFANKFIKKLEEIKQNLNSSNVELSNGLRVTRPTLIKFLNQDQNDQPYTLKITPAQINNLWETLTKDKDCEKNSNRQLLKERGPDELLKAAGFLPINKSVIEVNSDEYPQMFQLIMLLTNREWIEFNTYITVTQQLIDDLIERIPDSASNTKIKEEIKDKLFTYQLFEPKIRQQIIDKYEKCLKKYGEKSRNKKELITLASTIVLNEITKQEQLSFLDFDDVSYEFNRLTKIIYYDPKWEDIYKFFIKKTQEQETKFFTNNNHEQNDQEDKGYIPTSQLMTEVKISFRTHIEEETSNNNKFINFSYISNNSLFSNILMTIVRHLGIRHLCDINKINNETLNDNMDSLIKSTIVLKSESDQTNYFQGDWVSQKLLNSFICSLILASKKVIYFYLKDENNTKYEIYKKLVIKLAKHRENLNKILDASQTFQKDELLDLQFIDDNINEIDSIIQKIKSQGELNQLEKNFLIEFYHHKIINNNYKIRLNHILGCLEEAKATVKETDELINEISSNSQLENYKTSENLPIKIPLPIKLILSNKLFDIEKQLLNISIGNYNFGSRKNKKIDHNKIRDDIYKYQNDIKEIFRNYDRDKNIEIDGYGHNTGITSLKYIAESYFMVGQQLFYNQKYNSLLEDSYENFLHAAYFFLRIGFNRRVKQCLAFAGRSKIRLKHHDHAKQLISLLINIHYTDFGTVSNNSIEKDITFNLFYAEYELISEKQSEEAIARGLRGLKESLWKASPRRTTEFLYLIYCCSQELKQRTIREDLRKHFFDFSQLADITEETLKTHLLDQNYRDNKLLTKVIYLFQEIFNNLKNGQDVIAWGDVAHQFKETAIDFWDEWYKMNDSNKESEDIHPVSKQMQEDSFLTSFSEN